jgi:hypothetical protein
MSVKNVNSPYLLTIPRISKDFKYYVTCMLNFGHSTSSNK